MASSIPKTQLIFLGTERIVPNFKALDVMMEMLNRSAVGAKISNLLLHDDWSCSRW